jgi:hypothetical protein
MDEKYYCVKVKKRKSIAFPSVCNCCLKNTFDSDEREFTITDYVSRWVKHYKINIPFCIDCKQHVKRDIFLGRILTALVLLILLAFIFLGYSGKEGETNPMLNWIILIIIGVCLILSVSVHFYRTKWQEKLVSLGHGGAKDTTIIKEESERKIRFCFKNIEYARLFAQINDSKIEKGKIAQYIE